MKLKSIYLAGCLLAIASLAACNKDEDESLNDIDTNFLVQATYGNLAEVDAGQVAATKGQKDSVKMYGQMMVQEHTTAQAELTPLAQSKGVSLPSAPDPEHQLIKQKLLALNGYAFDTAYIKSQVADHRKTITLFENELANGQNRDVRNYAEKYLPHIKMHLQVAESIARGLY